jgi:Holliday junction resolvasome RuvABC endonuclease subunit
MSKRDAIIGIDPDSKRLTATVTTDDDDWVVLRKVLPDQTTNARRLDVAWMWVYRTVKKYRAMGYDVHVFIESPFVSPKFITAAIPLARLNGTMLAAAQRAGAVTVHETQIQSWKKDVVGNGSASKPDIERWCKVYWRQVWEYGQNITKTAGRQDIYDSAGINRYGKIIIRKMKHREKLGH